MILNGLSTDHFCNELAVNFRPGADGRKMMKPRRVEADMVKISATGTIINSEHAAYFTEILRQRTDGD